MYKVYIQKDINNKIYSINSEPYIADVENWILIDEGVGEKYLHAQNGYLPKFLRDEKGILRYLYVDGEIVERSEEELAAEAAAQIQPEVPNDLENRVAELETLLAQYEAAYAEGVNAE